MADGRTLQAWETYASQCINRKPVIITEDNWFAKQLKKLDINTIVDIGCGPGNWAPLFFNYNYYGFDQSPSMLELAKQNIITGKTVLGNARTLDKYFDKESIDMCFTSAVLQHNRHYPDKEEIVKGMYTILKPGGYYMCTENTFIPSITPECSGDDSYTDGYTFTVKGWELFMKQYGFVLIEYKQLDIAYEAATPTSLYLYQKI